MTPSSLAVIVSAFAGPVVLHRYNGSTYDLQSLGNGFGSGVVATPLLVFVLPMATTAPLVTILGFLVSVRQAVRGRRDVQWRIIARFIPGSLVGVPLGLWMVANADQHLLRRLLGAYVVAYALYSLFGERLLGRALTMPRYMVLRSFCISHIIHHRAQLGVYLRLNNIPVPSVYGPSADEGTM